MAQHNRAGTYRKGPHTLTFRRGAGQFIGACPRCSRARASILRLTCGSIAPETYADNPRLTFRAPGWRRVCDPRCADATSFAHSAWCLTCAAASASIPPSDLMARRFRELARRAAVKEVVLLGQTVKRVIAMKNVDFGALLRMDGEDRRYRAHPVYVARIRADMSDSIIEAMAIEAKSPAVSASAPAVGGRTEFLATMGTRLHGRAVISRPGRARWRRGDSRARAIH